MAGDENLGVAFALVMGAGASTAIGASVVFFLSLVKYASKKTLAAGLGLSAGVMMYVSFVEIFQKSVGGFTDAGIDDDQAYLYATMCFFAGIFLMMVMNFVVHSLLLGTNDYHHHHDPPQAADGASRSVGSGNNRSSANNNNKRGDHHHHDNNNSLMEREGPVPPVCCHDPAAKLERVQQMGHEMMQDDDNKVNNNTTDVDNSDDTNFVEEESATTTTREDARISKEESRKLNKMSMNTAIAIAMHNFPEGLATFVAALGDPAVGAVLAIAIAIHNIPEGLCVSLPVYYATGDRCRAFFWGCLSGISEPIAALLGWAVLASSFSDELYGVLFGMVAGMMVIISVRELLPTAHRYDPEDKVVTNSFIVGTAIMALSLVLFLL